MADRHVYRVTLTQLQRPRTKVWGPVSRGRLAAILKFWDGPGADAPDCQVRLKVERAPMGDFEDVTEEFVRHAR